MSNIALSPQQVDTIRTGLAVALAQTRSKPAYLRIIKKRGTRRVRKELDRRIEDNDRWLRALVLAIAKLPPELRPRNLHDA